MSSTRTPSARLFIGGLPFRYTEGQLLSLFVPFGRVVAVQIAHNQWGKSRGIGFVEFDNIADATTAKQKMHNHRVDVDRTIIVDFASPNPFDTEEGQKRHREALTHHKPRHSFSGSQKFGLDRSNQHPDRDGHFERGTQSRDYGSRDDNQPRAYKKYDDDRSFKPFKKFGKQLVKKSKGKSPCAPFKKYGSPSRQSVYDSRAHHSQVGKKFAKRNKSK